MLGAGRSLSFFYQRTMGSVFINGTGATNISNPSVAENNSPVPEDRVYFRYNFFKDALSVVGDSGAMFFDPSLGLGSNGGPRFRGITTTKNYDFHEFTFGGEKTFCDGRCSVEVRVPFSNSLASDLNLSVAKITNRGADIDNDSTESIVDTVSTPQNTLGTSDTEFGNMTVILKGLAYQSSHLAISGGASIGIPTGRDTRVRVTDFLGDFSDNDIEILRARDFHISNDTWSLSPFVAFLATPTERFFAQGFLQFDFPLNESRIDYTEAAIINTEPGEVHFDSLLASDSIREQTLMQVDLGTGYWLIKNRHDSWLTALAPTLELHYTTTLDNADLRVLPIAPKSGNLAVVGPGGAPIPEPNPIVGNQRGRVDILDLTFGATFVIGDRLTVANGFSFPLRSGDDRTFNWEYLLQINYYFGGPRNPERFAPPNL